MTGTPWEVPDPRKVTFTGRWSGRHETRPAVFLPGGFDVLQPQFRERLLEELALLRTQVALRALLEHRENVDRVPGRRQVDAAQSRDRVCLIPQIHSGRHDQPGDVRQEGDG